MKTVEGGGLDMSARSTSLLSVLERFKPCDHHWGTLQISKKFVSIQPTGNCKNTFEIAQLFIKQTKSQVVWE